jgi:hypothetical protein
LHDSLDNLDFFDQEGSQNPKNISKSSTKGKERSLCSQNISTKFQNKVDIFLLFLNTDSAKISSVCSANRSVGSGNGLICSGSKGGDTSERLLASSAERLAGLLNSVVDEELSTLKI